MAVTRLAISLILWISSSSEAESIAIVLDCFISSKTVSNSSFDVVFLRLLNFHVSSYPNSGGGAFTSTFRLQFYSQNLGSTEAV